MRRTRKCGRAHPMRTTLKRITVNRRRPLNRKPPDTSARRLRARRCAFNRLTDFRTSMEQAIFLTEKQMDKQMNSLTMTAREIFDVTGYKQPARQKRVFETLGVPVHIRPDGTVSVCRQHYLESHTHTQVQKMRLPQLRLVKRTA